MVKIKVILFFLAVFSGINSFPSNSFAEDKQPVEVSKNQMIKVSDRALDPETLRIKRDDSVVFFYNDSEESLLTLEVEFGSKHAHCASSNMKLANVGSIKSQHPFGPNDFSSTCFHEPGTYHFTVFGAKSNPAGLHGKVIVE